METIRALWSTEITKLKHTSTLWLSVIFPVVVLLELIGLLEAHYHSMPRPPRPLTDEWDIALRPLWTIWTVAVVPILVSLEAVGLASPEHAGKHWKQLYSLPIPRWSIYAAKTAVCALLMAASFLLFGIGAFALSLLRSGLFHLNLTAAIPWGLILQTAGGAYLASAALIAVQMWLSMRFSGFAIPMGICLAAILSGSVLRPLDLLGWWPWTMPMDSLPFGIDHVTPSPIVSPLAFAMIAVLAGWQLSRREVVQ
jgi:hypothetical protein